MKPDVISLKRIISQLARWRLTRLGIMILAVVVGLIVLMIVMLASRLANRSEPPESAVQPAIVQEAAERIFTTNDALDFVQSTYGTYLAALARESPDGRQAAPPYDSTLMIKRLQAIRPQLSPNLYKAVEAGYRQTASVTTIIRDEILCGRPDVTNVTPKLRLSAKESAVFRLELQRPDGLGLMEVTVDLIQRRLSELRCL